MKKVLMMFVIGASVFSASASFAAVNSTTPAPAVESGKPPCPLMAAGKSWAETGVQKITPPPASAESTSTRTVTARSRNTSI